MLIPSCPLCIEVPLYILVKKLECFLIEGVFDFQLVKQKLSKEQREALRQERERLRVEKEKERAEAKAKREEEKEKKKLEKQRKDEEKR